MIEYNYRRIFGERLKKMRKRNGYKRQQDFADAFSISLETVKNWEQGIRVPEFDQFMRLCDFLGCDLDYLSGRIDEKTHDLQFACDYIGLSSEAVEVLHLITMQQKSAEQSEVTITSEKTLSFLNRALRKSYIAVDNANKGVDIPVLTVFTDLEEYISADDIVCFSNGGVDEAFNKRELYLEAKAPKLRKHLEQIKDEEGK